MCAFKEEERSVLVSVTSMKGSAGFKSNHANFWHLVLYVCEGPNICDSQRLERKISFLFYLFNFFFAIRISRFLSFFVTRNKSASAIRRYPVRVLQTLNKQRTYNFWRVSDLQFERESTDSPRTCPVLEKQ